YEEGLTLKDKIEIGRQHLFDFSYPFFDEDYRRVFETNFIRNFYMREIGFETEELFKFRLETWLNIHMPYYNKLFESELIQYDPLTNAQMITAHEQLTDKGKTDERNINQRSETDGSSSSETKQDSISTGETTDDNFHRKVASDNPDSRLQLQTEEGKGVIEYASEIDENKTNNKSSSLGEANTNTESNDSTKVNSNAEQVDRSNSKVNEVEHFLERRFGKVGSDTYAKMVQEYRGALLRIEQQIHKEMQELFMLVY